MVVQRLAQITAEKTALRMQNEFRRAAMSVEEKAVEEEVIFHSRASGTSVDQAASAVGMAMRMPAITRSGRRVYNLVTNESLLAEEKRLNAACLLSARSRKSANEHSIFKSKKRKRAGRIAGSHAPASVRQKAARKAASSPNPPVVKKRGRPRQLKY